MFMEKESIVSEKHVSFWADSIEKQIAFLPLDHHEETETVIVGGGIAGISIAYRLIQMNRKVIVIDDGFIGGGETGHTTAHLVNALDDRYYNLEKTFGLDEAKLIAQSHSKAIDFIERTIREENIDCDFERVNGYLFLHPSDKYDSLKNE